MADALLARLEAHRALERFEAAVIVLQGTGDDELRARAVQGIERARQVIGAIETKAEPTPRSFQSSPAVTMLGLSDGPLHQARTSR